MIKKRIGIINYGMGNIHSVYNALLSLGIESIVTNNKKELHSCDAFILPGVGAFPNAIKNLLQLDLVDEIKNQVLNKNKNILGICLGMQLFADYSEEGELNEGLSMIPGKVIDLGRKITNRVPHIGWNSLLINTNSPLFEGICFLLSKQHVKKSLRGAHQSESLSLPNGLFMRTKAVFIHVP